MCVCVYLGIPIAFRDSLIHSSSNIHLRYVQLQHRHCCNGCALACPLMEPYDNFSDMYHQEQIFWIIRDTLLNLRSAYCFKKQLPKVFTSINNTWEFQFPWKHVSVHTHTHAHHAYVRYRAALPKSLFEEGLDGWLQGHQSGFCCQLLHGL